MNLFDLNAKISLDTSEYTANVQKATESGKGLASSLGHGLSSAAHAAGSAIKTAAKTAGVAIGAATSGIAALTTKAVKSYASFEQLVGGVQTLFGAGGKTLGQFAIDAGKSVKEVDAEYRKLKNSEHKVLNDAAEAFKTAGLSANEYMETVTGFSASLIQSLDGDTTKAAEIANMAIIDMSDNANKMGTDMGAIQVAYQGFAKQNYTMLDNLKLGYGGTKSEMERLIKKANELRKEQGKDADLTIESYADVVEAIHEVQTEIGITGTTAEEAKTTIEGSVNSMKAAFSNLITGFGDENANLKQLTQDLVDSIVIVAENIGPRIMEVLGGIKDVGIELAPRIAEGISEGVQNAGEFIDAGLDVLTSLGSAIMGQLPVLIDSALAIVTKLGGYIVENIPALLESAKTIIETLGTYLVENATSLLDTGITILGEIMDGMMDAPEKILSAADRVIESLAEYLTDENNRDVLLEKAIQIITNIVDSLVDHAPDMVVSAIEIIAQLATGLIEHLPDLIERIPGWVQEIAENFMAPENLEKMAAAGAELGQALLEALPSIADVFGHMGWGAPFGSLQRDSKTGKMYFAGDSVIKGAAKAVTKAIDPEGYEKSKELAEFYKDNPLTHKNSYDENGNLVASATGGKIPDFTSVNVADSTAAKMSAAEINAYNQEKYKNYQPPEMNINLVTPDGDKIARYMYDPLNKYADANGTPLVSEN